MANPDVTDEPLIFALGMTALQELDLNGTQVTDSGEEPESLRSGNTPVGKDEDH